MNKIIKRKAEASAARGNFRAGTVLRHGALLAVSGAAKNLEIWAELSSFWIKVRKGDFLKKAYKEKKKREKEIFRKIRMAK
ncbi:MAG: hypothetical protein J7M11_02210 [Elusimicrobia bacterium]|nr:hypothetical protein [Elusimicrobiota bacterium]